MVLTLASASPQRRELLHMLLGTARVVVEPPPPVDEPGFEDCRTVEAIDARLLEVARFKQDHARSQPATRDAAWLLTADTVIVGRDSTGALAVLGKPPASELEYRATVRRWFADYYAGKTHWAKTGLWLSREAGESWSLVVTTAVTFRSDTLEQIDWYIDTGEPRGKAGGYAIQGAGSLFVERIEGSLSNVVGLPLAETRALLQQASFFADEPAVAIPARSASQGE